MSIGKHLNNITVTHAPGQVGVTLNYDDAPTEHLLLPLSVAEKVLDKLAKACELAKQGTPPGDDLGITDGGAMRIVNPKEHANETTH